MATLSRDLDVITIGSVMAELSPAIHSQRVTDADHLVLTQAGSATNFAFAFARLGGRPGLIARTGSDELGGWIADSLAAAGVDIEQVRPVDEQLTPVSLASVDDHGLKSFSFYRFPGYSDPLSTLRTGEIPDSFLARSRMFVLTESILRSPGSREVAFDLAARAKRLGCDICLNPNFRATAWMGGVTEAGEVLRAATKMANLVVMNSEEAQVIAAAPTLERAVSWFQDQNPSQQTVVTQGDQPILLVENGAVTVVPVPTTEVVFDVGAGDVFVAALLAESTRGIPLESAVGFATKAATIKIGRQPSVDELPTRTEIESLP